jgi:hypothetical protein
VYATCFATGGAGSVLVATGVGTVARQAVGAQLTSDPSNSTPATKRTVELNGDTATLQNFREEAGRYPRHWPRGGVTFDRARADFFAKSQCTLTTQVAHAGARALQT